MNARNPQSVLVLGATSDLGRALAKAYAAEGRPLHLAGRDPDRLAAEVQDLKIRCGVPVAAHRFDVQLKGGQAAG